MKPKLLSVQKIWDHAAHSAMTDLIRFQNKWLCTFREGEDHVSGEPGVIRILESEDGIDWKSIACIQADGVDLRDPKLSITPEDRLMLLMGGTVYTKKGDFVSRQPRVMFSSDGREWTSMVKVLHPGDWLWRVTWHKGKAYGVSYISEDLKKDEDWKIALYESEDGITYKKITNLPVPSRPSETTLRFFDTGEMVALVRRGGGIDRHAWIGWSPPPYIDWSWADSNYHLGGPNFLITEDGRMWASGRLLEQIGKDKYKETTVLHEMQLNGLKLALILPSGGEDTSYPGMVIEDGILWMSYYSSHEEKTAIYLAKIQLP